MVAQSVLEQAGAWIVALAALCVVPALVAWLRSSSSFGKEHQRHFWPSFLIALAIEVGVVLLLVLIAVGICASASSV